MANLYESVLNVMPHGIKSRVFGASSCASDLLIQVLPELKAYYNNDLKKYNTLLSIMSSIPQCIADDNFDEYLNDDATVNFENDEVVAMAYTDIHDWIDQFGNDDHFIQLSDSEGNVYNLGYDSEWSIVSRTGQGVDHFIFYEDGAGYGFRQTITDVNGNIHSFWSVIGDLVETSALNEVLYHACNACNNTSLSLSDFGSIIGSYANTKYQSVKDCVQNITSAFARAGIYGVVQYIADYFRTAASLQVTDDGLIAFTNNKSLVPQIYLAGMVKTVGLLASTLVSAVLAAVNPVLSGLGMVITGIVNTVIGGVNYDYEQNTTAQMDPSANTILTPMALCQSSGNISILSSWDQSLVDVINAGVPFKIQVPGGELIISTGAKSGSSIPTRYEFHPDTIDRRAALSDFIDSYGEHSWTQSGSDYIFDLDWDGRPSLDTFITCFEQGSSVYLTNNDNGVLSADDDWTLRKIVATNIYIFLLYQCTCFGNYLTKLNIRCSDVPGVLGVTSLANPNTDWSNGDAAIGLGYIASVACMLPLYSLYENIYKTNCSWKRILNAVSLLARSSLTPVSATQYAISSIIDANAIFQSILAHGYYFGNIDVLGSALKYNVKIPKYDRGSLWLSAALIGAATVLATVIIVSVSIAAVKAIRTHRTKLAMNAERTWGQYVANPSADTAKAYQKAVLKNNWYVKVFGGTSFSRSGFWSSTEANSEAPVGKIFSKLNSSLTESSASDVSGVKTDVITLDTIYHLIAG